MCELGVQDPDKAWGLTPQEFWILHDWKMDKTPPQSTAIPPMTRKEMEALERELDERARSSRS